MDVKFLMTWTEWIKEQKGCFLLILPKKFVMTPKIAHLWSTIKIVCKTFFIRVCAFNVPPNNCAVVAHKIGTVTQFGDDNQQSLKIKACVSSTWCVHEYIMKDFLCVLNQVLEKGTVCVK